MVNPCDAPDTSGVAGTPFKAFGKRLEELREARGWRQAELARRVGVDPSTVFKWEEGQQPPEWKNLQLLASVLGVHVVVLVEPLLYPDQGSESQTVIRPVPGRAPFLNEMNTASDELLAPFQKLWEDYRRMVQPPKKQRRSRRTRGQGRDGEREQQDDRAGDKDG